MTSVDDQVIDARGLSCPQPVLLLRQALRPLNPGCRVTLLTTDPMASIDVRAFCLRAGHVLLSEETVDGHTRFTVARG
jgi:tRNA 2-thiouridine synthesizing protein A